MLPAVKTKGGEPEVNEGRTEVKLTSLSNAASLLTVADLLSVTVFDSAEGQPL